jgi:phosphatidylglycerophosphate synthase
MWSDIAAIYRASKKKKDINWWTEWVCRPPAAVIVYALRSTPITPNQITFASFALAVVSGALFILVPSYLGLVAAALLFELSFILDCADGQLARLRKHASVLGHLLDFLMDEIKALLLYACVTARLWLLSGDPRYLLVGLGGLFALAAGLSLTAFMRRPEYSGHRPTEDGQPAVIAQRRSPIGRVVSLLEHAARTVVHYPSYIWLVALLDRIDIYFWAYGAVSALYFARCMLAVALRLGRFDAGKRAAVGSPEVVS